MTRREALAVNLSLSRSDDVPLGWLDTKTLDKLRAVAAGLEPVERAIDVIIVNDARIQEINNDFRGKNSPTDVLSFSYVDDEGPGGEDDIVGEVYISHETLAKEAKALGVDPKHLFLRIGVHGLLHVIGYDHGTEKEAARMESEERRLLEDQLGSGAAEALF